MKKRDAAYHRISWIDRLKIEALYNAGHTYRFIADQTGFSVSSVHSEIQHGLYPHMGAECTRRPLRYSAQLGQDYADVQATSKGVEIKLGHNHAYARYIASEVRQGHSLDSIVGSLRLRGEWTVSTPTLYRYVDRGYIPNLTNKHLPEKPRRKPRKNHVRPAARPPAGTSIERRPLIVSSRTTFGHWEMDSVIGKNKGKRQSFIVLTERLTRFEVIFRVSSKTAAATVRAFECALAKFPKGTFQTVTVDNGCEFADCHGLEYGKHKEKRVAVYYCHPFCSCERGSNERQNRVIRRYFPKGHSLAKYTQKDCDRVASGINSMPRKILGYATSADLFAQEIAKLQIPS